MLKIITEDIRSLRFLLDTFYYDMLYSYRRAAKELPLQSRLLIDLFSKNKILPLKHTQKIIGAKNIDNFFRLNLIGKTENGKLKSKYSIYTLNNFYFVYKRDESVYLGEDSRIFAKYLPLGSNFNKILDLCTGSGIQAILMARNGQKVIGVDLSPEAVNAAKFNATLNGLEKRIEILRGDCYSPVRNKKFDLIISNPPYIPIPEGVPYPLAGKGADDGVLVLRRILKSISVYLEKNGTGLIFGVTQGGRKQPKIAELLNKICKKYRMDISLIILERIPKAIEIAGRSSFISDNYQGQELLSTIKKMEEVYRKTNATHLYAYLIKIRKRKGSLRLIDLVKKESDYIPTSSTSLNELYGQFEACFMKKQYYKAISIFEKISKMSAVLGIKYKIGLNLPLGVCYLRTKQFDKAIKKFFEYKKNTLKRYL